MMLCRRCYFFLYIYTINSNHNNPVLVLFAPVTILIVLRIIDQYNTRTTLGHDHRHWLQLQIISSWYRFCNDSEADIENAMWVH